MKDDPSANKLTGFIYGVIATSMFYWFLEFMQWLARKGVI